MLALCLCNTDPISNHPLNSFRAMIMFRTHHNTEQLPIRISYQLKQSEFASERQKGRNVYRMVAGWRCNYQPLLYFKLNLQQYHNSKIVTYSLTSARTPL